MAAAADSSFRSGLVLVVSAASGTGKTSLIEAVLKENPDLQLSISHTTRPPRSGEMNGENYHFVSEEDFRALKAAGRFIETAEVFGHSYGTSREQLEAHRERSEDIVLELDWQGAMQVKETTPSAVLIFLLPPSLDALKKRLEARGKDTPETIQRRLDGAQFEISQCREFDYLVVNDDFEVAKASLCAIIRAERARTDRIRDLDGFLQTAPSNRP